jgi:hypothetical protein
MMLVDRCGRGHWPLYFTTCSARGGGATSPVRLKSGIGRVRLCDELQRSLICRT